MKTVKIGVIGCGGIANNKHMPAYSANKRAELVAFCDIVEERAIKANEKFGNENTKYYTDYKELLKDKSIDAVLVLTHNAEHCRITVDALNAGKHVLCEKPMAMNYEEAKKMIEARDKSGKILTIGYQNRFRPDSMYLKKLADEDTFGDIYYAEATAVRRRGVPTWGVFIEEEKQGGGPLIDIGTHALDLTLFVMNNYEPAYCVGKTFHKLNKQTNTGNMGGDWDPERFTAEDSAFGFVVMKNGALINLRSSWALNIIESREAVTLVCGDKAGADMPAMNKVRVNGVMAGKQYILEPNLEGGKVDYFGDGGTKPADLEAGCFIGAIFGENDLVVTADQAACVTKILEGIYESEKTGKPYYFD
ncbi:MAG: Gfo/Idh/MocA family oxidoreductase [Clostridia bacterium]|nr:Gfo/Idh/MocA family oxidoreductase [Clostridia bacterium]